MMRMMGRIGLLIVVLASLAVLAGCQSRVREQVARQESDALQRRRTSPAGRGSSPIRMPMSTTYGRFATASSIAPASPTATFAPQNKYKNYHLHVEWRWPETPTNSGVLLHANGKDEVWPACIECQLKAGNAGDLVLINGTGISVNGVSQKNSARRFVVIEKKSPTSELPAGQWNSYDIYCQGDSVRCLVNGVPQNEGTDASVASGWIGLQSEGSPIEFRNVYLQPLE